MMSGRDRLDRVAKNRIRRRRFLATALASAAVLVLPGCDAPTFDPNTATFTFRRSTYPDGRRN